MSGHRLQDDPYDMEIRGFGRILIWYKPIDSQMWCTCGLSVKFLIGLEKQYPSIG